MAEFAYTGPSPEKGNVGYVNLTIVNGGVRFTVRSEGENPPTADHVVPLKEAADLLCDILEALPDNTRHDFWRAGEPDCPPEIKAGNGELHTLRCKRCGQDDPRPRDGRCPI